MPESTFPINRAQAEKDQSAIMLAFLKDAIDLVIRRKWWIIIFVLLGLSVGGALAWMKKDVYRSSTVILIEQQKIPENYVPSVVGGTAAGRLSTITQQVLSRTNLQKVIDEFHLFPDIIKNSGYEPVVKNLRKNITLDTKGSRGQLESFTLSFAHQDPMMAMTVTAKLASQYMNENIKIREQFIEGATEFLEQELGIAEQALNEKEKALSEFKLQYAGELPGQLETNLRTLDRLQKEASSIHESINGSNTRLQLLQKSIRDYEAMAGTLMEFSYAPMQSVAGPMPGPLMRSRPLINRIEELKRELIKLSGEFTDAYPDVISLKTQIKNLEKELALEAEESPQENSSVLEEDETLEFGAGDLPIFDPYLAELNNARDELKTQLGMMRARLKKIAELMGNYQRRIDQTPTREQALLVLQRDYSNMQASYQNLHGKRLSAKIAENLDKRQKGERFRILDPANLPRKPEGFPRFFMVLGGVVAGAGLGFGIVFLLDMVSPTFRRSEDAEVCLGVSVLATIPSFRLAYGKSMKMLSGDIHSSSSMNGEAQGVGSRSYFKVGGNAKSARKKAIPSQMDLVVKWRPESIVAEQFRVAATRLDLLGERSMGNVVLVTSAMKGEGKTSTATNLAYTLARDLDEPTLLIECDYKCPNLHNVMGLPPYPGVADYLVGDVSLESCSQHIQDVPLWCMTVGDLNSYPVSLSKLQHLSSLIESVRPRYRFIILDCPPILPLADINILSGMADIGLMVVRSGVTPKDVVQKATEILNRSTPTRLILTDAWSQGMPYYVRHGYSMPYALTSSK